jgi:DNA polymerase
MSAAGAVTRSVLTAGPGKELIVCDLSAIEGRVLAWMAGEEGELEIYRSGKDPYIASAAMILHKRYEDVTKEERQSPGKISVLACGYNGSVGAVRKFGGEGMTDDEIKDQIVKPWREAHPMTTAFWYDVERACMSAVKEPGKVFTARAVGYKVSNRFLQCRLPSGRLLYYYDPDIRDVETSWGEMKESVTYMTVDGMTKKWVRTNTYGGKSVENIVQGTARDIMVHGMLLAEEERYPLVLSVHDELLAEVPEGFGSVEEFEELMCAVPSWVPGLPLDAHGFRSKRYKK